MDDVEDFYHLTFVILCTIVTVGTVGNIISIIVWSKGSRCHTSPLATYFKILSVCDLFILLVPGLESVLKYVPENSIQLRAINGYMCKFFIFTLYFGVQLSAWVTVAMTIECTTALCFPVQFYHRSRKTRCAFLVSGLIVLVLTGLNIPICLTADLVTIKRNGKIGQYCNVQNISHIVNVLTYLSSTGFYVVLPVMLFVICDLIILINLCQMRCTTSVHRILTRNLKTNAKLIVSINLIHIVTDIPVFLSFLIRFDIIEMDPSNLRILSVISYGCLYLSNAVNITLYMMMKTAFRHDFKTLYRRWFMCRLTKLRRKPCRKIKLNAGGSNMVKGLKYQDNFWV